MRSTKFCLTSLLLLVLFKLDSQQKLFLVETEGKDPHAHKDGDNRDMQESGKNDGVHHSLDYLLDYSASNKKKAAGKEHRMSDINKEADYLDVGAETAGAKTSVVLPRKKANINKVHHIPKIKPLEY